MHKVFGRHRFIGYDNSPAPFKDGKFTIGKVYDRISDVDTYGALDFPDDAVFIDDDGNLMWETMDAFEEVTE